MLIKLKAKREESQRFTTEQRGKREDNFGLREPSSGIHNQRETRKRDSKGLDCCGCIKASLLTKLGDNTAN